MRPKRHAQRAVKFLHTASTIGLAGGLAAYMIVLATGPEPTSLSEYAAMRHSLAAVSKWLLIPSMVVVLFTGLLAMVVHTPFLDTRWAWVKAFSGILVFEASLASLDGPAQRAATLSQRALSGEIDQAALVAGVNDEWTAWWTLLALAAFNTVLGVWRPKLGRRRD